MLVHPIYRIVVFIAKIMFNELFDGNVYGDSNIPRHGPCLIACNHLSYFDPPFVGSAVRSREVFSLARSSLFRTKFRNWLFGNMNCISLERQNGDIKAIKTALRMLNDDKCLMIFPEGTRSADGMAKAPLAGIGMLACKTKTPVVPCKIFGTFEIMNRSSKFFDWNKKANIVFGPPLLAANYMPDENVHEKNKYKLATQIIMSAVEKLQIPSWEIS